MERKIPLCAAMLLYPLLIAAFVAPNTYTLRAQQPNLSPTAQLGGSVAVNLSIPKVEYLSPLESEIIAEMNLARSQPQVYASYLEEIRKYYSGNQFRYPGREAEVTVEGLSAVEEAIKFLRSASPLPPLQVYKGMSMAAKDHATYLGTSGNTGHKGGDGSTPNVRISRYGDWANSIGENIVYQATTTAREAVMGLIVDDGIDGRGHRKNIFDSTYRAAGISLGTRSSQGTLCVITFAGGFMDKSGAAATPAKKLAARQY
ncbi:MAG TPA: CAP domain-containing protein [Pyrinomonadaceae bacterium]|jgi:uncharacterized protein YkwD|nr:CAP domain-containing protein [Pyrinomonadaceae bacterium]